MSEIYDVLQRVHKHQGGMFIWQNHDGLRAKMECVIDNLDLKGGTMTLKPRDAANKLDVKKELSLYFKGEERDMLFKQEIVRTDPAAVVLKIPKEVHMVEKRASPRKCFDFYDEHKLSIAKFEPGSNKPRRFDLVLFDYSHHGAAFFVTKQQAVAFAVGDQVYVIELDGLKLPSPQQAPVKYIAKYVGAMDDSQGHRLGVQFNAALPPGTLPE